jgi:hypothetical protein
MIQILPVWHDAWIKGNDWRHESRDYNIKNHKNVKVKFKLDICNKNGCIYLQNFAHIFKFVHVFGRYSVRIPDSITDCSDWGSSSCYSVPPDNFKSDSDNLIKKLIFNYLSCFQNTWSRTGTIER